MGRWQGHAWCLRFLSGAAKGRTIALDRGENLVGTLADCDVVLAGGDIQPRHLVLQVGDIAVVLQRLGDAPVALNGGDVGQRRRSLVAGDELVIGSCRLQLDRSHATTPPEVGAPPTDFVESILCGEAERLDAEPIERRAAPAGPWIVAWVLGCVALALAGWSAWRGMQDDAPPDAGPTAAVVQRAVSGFDEVEVLTLPGAQQFTVRGYVETRTRRLALQEAVEGFGRRVTVNVHAVDELIEQARRYVGDPAIAFSYQGQGRVVLTGASDDAGLRKRIRQLAEDLQPAVLVTDRVRYHDDHAAARPSGAGALTQASRAAQWASWQAELPARIVGVTDDGSGSRYIQLENGSRYYEGSVLRSGARLDRIDGHSLSLGSTGRPDGLR